MTCLLGRLKSLPCSRYSRTLAVLGLVLLQIGRHFAPDDYAEAQQSVAGTMDSPGHFLTIYCASCHTQGRSGSDIDLDVDLDSLQDDRATWERVLDRVRRQQMPPHGVRTPQPSNIERAKMVAWLEDGLANPSTTPKPYATRLLQGHEYQNAIRDLLGMTPNVVEAPASPVSWRRHVSIPAVPTEALAWYQAAADSVLAKVDLARCGVLDLSVPLAACGSGEASEDERASQALLDFARRAFRRPLERHEATDLLSNLDQARQEGASTQQALTSALKAVLTSPHFLYRIESRIDPEDAEPAARGSSFDLASRLSFLIWSSIPDDELLSLAECGALEQELPGQVRRMLKNPKARAFAADFARFWLHVGDFPFPDDMDESLARAAQLETIEFMYHIVAGDRSVMEFVDADYTFLNERLAKHYGIAGVPGDHMRRVSTAGTTRGGLLTHASVLAATSWSDRPSIVKRGKWILDNILGTPPPPPPVGQLAEFAKAKQNLGTGSARTLLERHRSISSCAKCHNRIDSLGIALENFDVAGGWRITDGPHPIDAKGELPTGETIDGPLQLKAYLRGQHRLFLQCLSGKLLGYALGRKIDDMDRETLADVPDLAAADEYRFSSILLQIVQSEPFQRGGMAR